MSDHTSTARFGGRGMLIGIIACAAIAVAGICLWIYQLTVGLAVTNMRNLDSWGLYITNFMFFVGLSAGGLIISSAPRVFGAKGFGGVSKVAVWTSIVCTVLAAAFVIIDLGGPARIWELVAYANFTSPLMWDICVITAYLVISIIYLWAMVRFEKGTGTARALKVLSTVALVTAILVHSVTAWIFSLQVAHEFWYTALMAPWFVSSALVSGLALVMIVVVVLRRAGYMKLDDANLVKMAKLLGTFICIDLYFLGCDLLTAGFPGGAGTEVVSMLVSGPVAPFFWTEVVGGIVAAGICFVPKLRTGGWLTLAAALGIVGVFCKRCQIILAGFGIQNVDYAGVVTGTPLTDAGAGMMSIFSSLSYFPSLVEFGIVLAVIALGGCILLVGFRYLPLQPVETTE